MRFKSRPERTTATSGRAKPAANARAEANTAGSRADGQERRERLLAAATELFARQGFEQTTTRQIADLAKSNIAAIKYYFGDKQGLIIAVMEAARAKIVDGGTLMVVTPQEDARQSMKQWVGWVLRTARRRRQADAATASLLIKALAMKPALIGPIAAKLGAPVRANILTLVDELTDRTLSPAMRETAFAFIFSLCSNFIHNGVLLENMGITLPENDADLDRYAERLTDFIIGGLHTMTDLAHREDARRPNPASGRSPKDAKA